MSYENDKEERLVTYHKVMLIFVGEAVPLVYCDIQDWFTA